MNYEYQIAQFLNVANEQLTFCEEIIGYPNSVNKKNYDPSSEVDNFYMSTCNAFFNDSLLIISSLLNKKDTRVISFWNWKDFTAVKSDRLKEVTDSFVGGNLDKVRNQVVAHQDLSNHNNNVPSSRRRGIINEALIRQARNTLDQLIAEFCDFATTPNRIYNSSVYFSNSSTKKQIKNILSQAKPRLTNNDVI